MISIALLVRRYYVRGVTTKENHLKFVMFFILIVASSMGISAYWGLRPNGLMKLIMFIVVERELSCKKSLPNEKEHI
jgi:APA family basic amino acid/polyamine antiporter